MVGRIKELCRLKGITVAELERLCGIPENSIYKWDTHSPSVHRVAKAARVLGVTVENLIGGDTVGLHDSPLDVGRRDIV